MTRPRTSCCADFAARRRPVAAAGSCQGVAATGAGAVATTMFGDALRQTSFAATTGGNVLVVISLRGGIDGLGMVVPHGDPAYYAARPTIAVPASTLVAKDAMFGLHPAMTPLEWLCERGELAAVHAVGMDQPNRSHFLAMEEIEDADPASSVRRGWVNRMVGLDAGSSPTEAVHLSHLDRADACSPDRRRPCRPPQPRRVLRCRAPPTRARRGAASTCNTVWGGASGVLGAAGRSALQVVDRLGPVAAQTYRPRTAWCTPKEWPAGDLAAALADTAQLIRADVGTEVDLHRLRLVGHAQRVRHHGVRRDARRW